MIITSPEPREQENLQDYDAIAQSSQEISAEESGDNNSLENSESAADADSVFSQNYIFSMEQNKVAAAAVSGDFDKSDTADSLPPVFDENGKILDMARYNELYTFIGQNVLPDVKQDRIDVIQMEDSAENPEDEGYFENSGYLTDIEELKSLYSDYNEDNKRENSKEILLDDYSVGTQSQEASVGQYIYQNVPDSSQVSFYGTAEPDNFNSKEIERYPSSTPIPIKYNNPSFYNVESLSKSSPEQYSHTTPASYPGFSTFTAVQLNDLQYNVVTTTPSTTKYRSTGSSSTPVPTQNNNMINDLYLGSSPPSPESIKTSSTPIPLVYSDVSTHVPVHYKDIISHMTVQYKEISTPSPVQFNDKNLTLTNVLSTGISAQNNDHGASSEEKYNELNTNSAEKTPVYSTLSSDGYNIVSFFNTLETEGSNQKKR